MRFVRDEVHVQVGQPVTLRVVNRDGYAHAFDIDAFDIHRLLATKETAEIIFTPER
jgi:heme/copper-type cytochrome/quinol oxidase subunit 2